MKILLFLLGIVFFFIFFLFSQIPGIEGFFVPDLFWIANIYIGIAVSIIFLLFFQHSATSTIQGDLDNTYKKILTPSIGEIKVFVRFFFSLYIYYIACGLFYGALYIILKSFYDEVSIPLLFVLLNTVVIILYFIEHKFRVFQDFIRVNLVLISLYYICIHSLFLLGFSYEYHIFDFINILGVFLLFGILLGSNRYKKYSKILKHYFIAFTFLEISTLYKMLFSGELLSVGVIAGFVGGGFLIYTTKIYELINFSKAIVRIWGLILLSIFIIISLFYVGKEDIYALILIPFLCVSSQLLLYFHYNFQNYWAITVGLFGYMGAIYGIYAIIFSEIIEDQYLSFLCFIFSLVILTIHRVFKRKFFYDTYFFHSLSLLVNLLGVFYFFYLRDFSILLLGILLLGESIYLFFSYYTVSKTKTLG